ncbi:metallophosphoesterase family protein [Erythrobacter litoralis]|uniref:Putative serine/threonine protein phosphatase n=1 Tax=Erythrobacter litoralis (strain HTCC2594) TaxID=314225 RepID=Q2NDA5_ERYLH|nr:metallophosphoesterase family protein [Erythrobacter litoralis]ABC62336.1 putative serine/threonine protein phosphatase [Erythrobacter litoralis HTCC2594]
MLKSIKKLIRSKSDAPSAFVPEGTRYYAIGDIHGRNDLFEALIKAIDKECDKVPELDTQVVLLGDLVDRGPESAKVIENARAWKKRRPVRILAGNHEEMFLQSFENTKVLRHFLRHGGRDTILSYGISPKKYNAATLDELQELLHDLVPKSHRKFIKNFEEMVIAGDYVFVHAGIKPKVALEEQARDDLLWIRDRFLAYDQPHPRVVVHGHTIFEDVDEKSNRIGIDTGAFRFGRLTALVLEENRRRMIQAVDDNGTIRIEKRDSLV